ncbi:LysR family transcriptional regulator [Mycobacterium sp. pUA109]|uniref:LysR family transcriptional regulator n=1 Tax=Mycobacterium sp. pUA109 TaxID=3238982 RepID=UPI00351B8456
MDTHRLKYFLRIADEGSISRAAAVLGIAQPALSRQVRQLEEELGVALFRRTARGVELTDEGEQLRASTAAPLRQLELAMQWVGSPWGRVERALSVGMPAPVASVLAAPLMTRLKGVFPKVNIRVTVADSVHLVEKMLKDDLDFAVLHGPPPDERLFYRDIVAEHPVLVGGPDSDLDPARPVAFTALADLPLVLPTMQPGLNYTIQNTALRRKITIDSQFETDSLQVSKSVIETGRAYGILPLAACRREVDDGRLRYAPLCDPVITQHIGLAVRPQAALPRGFVTRFGEMVRNEAAELVRRGVWPADLLAAGEWRPADLLAAGEWRDEPRAQAESVCLPPQGMPQRSFGAPD